MHANPLISAEPDPGGAFYGATDGSVGGSAIQSVRRGPMNDAALTGEAVSQATVPVYSSGKTNVYVGALVLAALAGMIAWHFGGFDAHLFVGRRS